MSKFTEKLAKITGGSPLETGVKFETETLAGKVVHFNAADVVEYHDKEKNEDVRYTVWATSEGYYRGGQQLNEIYDAIREDKGLLDEFQKFGITVVLNITKTKAGTKFVKVAVIENREDVEEYDIY